MLTHATRAAAASGGARDACKRALVRAILSRQSRDKYARHSAEPYSVPLAKQVFARYCFQIG